jgi:UDP-hydrolysing UDP-N-acetyl-D-glucosamine 2-epimerase
VRLALLTTGRQDWGILRSTCLLLARDPRFELRVIAGGMHCSAQFGATRGMLHEDGVSIDESLAWLPDRGPLPSATEQAGLALRMVGEALERQDPDAMLVVGDRLETAAAALAATLASRPLIHLHGGEETEGAIDNALRHAITKLAHLHLVSHSTYASRVRQMGENPDSVHVVGAPGLDNLHREDLSTRAELEADLGILLTPPVVIVTLHPTTLALGGGSEALELCAAIERVPATYIFTLPNSDPGNQEIRAMLLAAAARPARKAVDALGARRYWGLMRVAEAILGNSSSALIEAPVLGLPAVNVGDRQRGRLRGDSVIDVAPERGAIAGGLQRAVDPSFRRGLRKESPLGDGRSAERIRDVLLAWTPPMPPRKRWFG